MCCLLVCVPHSLESYPSRSYHGRPEYTCRHCGAIFWYAERTTSSSLCTSSYPQNYSCCRGGKIYIRPYKDPPPYLRSLFNFDAGSRARNFLRNIRQYNCLFNFISIGARIDYDIKRGSGICVFKINGQVCHRIGSLLPAYGEPPHFATTKELIGSTRCNQVKRLIVPLIEISLLA